MTTLDDNWQNDALDPSLGYAEATLAIRAGYHRTDEGEHSEAIFATSSYVYQSAKDAADHLMVTKKAMCTHATPILPCVLLSGVWHS